MTKVTFKVWNVPCYFMDKDEFEILLKEDYEEYDLNDLVDILQKNTDHYHCRIHNGQDYVIFGDIDGYDKGIERFKNLFINFMKKHYNIILDDCDIKYTNNKVKKGSYHYSIPKYFCKTENNKEIARQFVKEYPEFEKGIIDVKVYCERWFRYPNQLKENINGSEHVIINGQMKDFVVEHIPSDSIDINDLVDKNIQHLTKRDHEQENKKIDRDTKGNGLCTILDEKKKSKVELSIVKNMEIEDRIQKYLDCCDKERFSSYGPWIDLAFICFNSGTDFEFFNKISGQLPNYKGYDDCKKYWDGLKDCGNEKQKITIKSLIKWAQDENYLAYQKARRSDKIGLIDEILTFDGPTDQKYAYLYACIKHNKVIYDETNDLFYFVDKFGLYKNDKRLIKVHNIFNKYLFAEINKRYNILKNNLKLEINKLRAIGVIPDLSQQERKNNNIDIQNCMKNMNRLTKYFKKCKRELETHSTKRGVFQEIKGLYAEKNLDDKLDTSSPYVFAFNNGVYDLKNRCFRKATPEEYCLKTCGYDYEEPDSTYIEKLYKIFNDIFPDNCELKYVLTTLGTCLIYDNKLEEYYIWIGSGGNGKGIFSHLLKVTLHDYFDEIPIQYFCQNKAHETGKEADPCLANKKGIRVVLSSEPEKNKKLKTGTLKKLTGGDTITARQLFKEPFKFIPKFKCILQTNDIFGVDGSDSGNGRRLRIVKFLMQFVEDPKLPNQRKRDSDLKGKFDNDKKWRIAFFHILKDHYFEFLEAGGKEIPMPPRFKRDTEEYLKDFDPINDFIEDKLDRTDNSKDMVGVSVMHKTYDEYRIENKQPYMNRQIFKDAMIKKGFFIKVNNKGTFYMNVKIKDDIKELDDDDDDDMCMFLDDM